ncbi:hypothetical protein ES703_42169 [subsurface metagenome]
MPSLYISFFNPLINNPIPNIVQVSIAWHFLSRVIASLIIDMLIHLYLAGIQVKAFNPGIELTIRKVIKIVAYLRQVNIAVRVQPNCVYLVNTKVFNIAIFGIERIKNTL